MKRRLERAKEFVDLSITWQGNVCIYGAGNFGTGWAFELINDYALMKVDFYVDTYKAGQNINGIEIKNIDYLKERKDVTICFIALAEEMAIKVYEQLQSNGIEKVFVLSDPSFVDDLDEYICEYCDEKIIERYQKLTDDKQYLTRMFKKRMGYELDIENPKTFNEKLQWLKVNERQDILPLLTDKYLVREYIREKFGEQYLIPLLFVTEDYREITDDNIPNENCIIKTNCGSHDYYIIRNKKEVDIEILQNRYKDLLDSNYYYKGREWNYKNINPCIIIEKLLEDKNGKIPNDYKLTFFNGELQFVYCSIDREGDNYRKIYDPNWNPMDFSMGHSLEEYKQFPDIEPPKSLNDMIRIGKEIAKELPYVRVDFYDVDGKLYCGEITLYHGSGFDKFYPEKYDRIWGERLKLKVGNDELYK